MSRSSRLLGAPGGTAEGDRAPPNSKAPPIGAQRDLGEVKAYNRNHRCQTAFWDRTQELVARSEGSDDRLHSSGEGI